VTGKKYLVDTSVWIFALRKKPNKEIKSLINRLLKEDAIVTTGLIKLELLGGVKKESDFLKLKQHLDALIYIEVDSSLWEEAANLAFVLRRNGVTVAYTDVLIAAVAMKKNIILLHADNHFDLIAEHSKLRTSSYADKI
jgi:predicted nucleic acid-binding protein